MINKRTHKTDGARARACAALAVDWVLTKGRTLDQAFAEVLGDAFSERECAQIKALAFGALRWHPRHQVIISELLERPLRARDKILEALLSVGLFELIDDRQPGYAIVSAAVDASCARQEAAADTQTRPCVQHPENSMFTCWSSFLTQRS